MFILNHKARVYHDGHHLTERCNTDAINDRSKSDLRPLHISRWHQCSWCCKESGRHRNEVRELTADGDVVCLYCGKP